jgi:hypothetical protein
VFSGSLISAIGSLHFVLVWNLGRINRIAKQVAPTLEVPNTNFA